MDGGPLDKLILNLMSATTLRSKVIAGNISNQNTPGYARRFVRFEDVLAKKLGHASSLSDQIQALEDTKPVVDVDVVSPLTPNGNNVNLEAEMNSLRENKLLFELYATILSGRTQMIQASIEMGN